MRHTAFIALGSNLNDPIQQVTQAIHYFAQSEPTCNLLQTSSLYRSAPLQNMQQPDYINAVIQIATALLPLQLLDFLQNIEQLKGRVRSEGLHWQARTLDLDLLLYDNLQYSDVRLTIPHPHMLQRSFVLVPLLEIAPHMTLPNQQSLSAAVAALKNTECNDFAQPIYKLDVIKEQ